MTENPENKVGSLIIVPHMRNLKAEEYLRDRACASIPGISDKTLSNLRSVLEVGLMRGEHPRTIALEIVGRIDPNTKRRAGGLIGLSKDQQEEIKNFIRCLEQLDDRYFSFEDRDKRFDKTVKKAIQRKENLAQDTLDRIQIAFENRALLCRGERLAQSEIMHSINRTEYFANLELIRDGKIHPQAMTKEWWACDDEPNHVVIGTEYDKQLGIPIEEPFVTPAGSRLLYPGDTSLGAPPSEILDCCCKVYFRVDWLYGVC